jgi:hypothetical protein
MFVTIGPLKSRGVVGLFPLLLVMIPFPGWANEFDRVSAPCRIERLAQARAACLANISDVQQMAIDRRLAAATSDLQAATGPEIRAFEASLAQSQAAWQEAMLSTCEAAAQTVVEFEACRLNELIKRNRIVKTTLDASLAELGAGPAYRVPIPDSVEVLVPLVPPIVAGPAADLRVPLVLPLQP